MNNQAKKSGGVKWYHIHAVHTVIILLFYMLFSSSLYSGEHYIFWQGIINWVAILMISLGWIPLYRAGPSISLRDYPYFLTAALLRRRFSDRKRIPKFGTYWRHDLTRHRWLLLFVKAYYLPLSVSGIYGWGVAVFLGVDLLIKKFSFIALLVTVEVFVMWISSIVASCGYSIESKKFGYPIKAVETNLFGIIFCIICYHPLNELVPGRWISGDFSESARIFADGSFAARACMFMMVFFMVIHVSAIITQGLRFANLTYRGVVSKGLYRYVRHPQYFTKILWFFFAWLPQFSSVKQVLFYLGWVFIYVGRTLTEERFLKQFPDYRDYCEKVKWRYIPGVW